MGKWVSGMIVGLTEYEWRLVTRLKRLGFTVLRGGWPDFLVIGQDHKIRMVVEAKSPTDGLWGNQPTILRTLAAAGLTVRVVTDENMRDVLTELDAMDRGLPTSPTWDTPEEGLLWMRERLANAERERVALQARTVKGKRHCRTCYCAEHAESDPPPTFRAVSPWPPRRLAQVADPAP